MKKIFLSTVTLLGIMFIFVSCSNSSDNNEESLYSVQVGEKYGFINSKGRIIIEPQYDWVNRKCHKNLFFVKVGEKKYWIDKIGNIKYEFADSVFSVSEPVGGIAKIKYDKGYGVINENGQYIISSIENKIEIIEDNDKSYIIVEGKNNDKDWYITDNKGKVIGARYDEVFHGFSNGLCAVKLSEKWGYIDTTGTLVIDAQYEQVRVFSEEGLARVVKDGKQMYIDKTGQTVINVDRALTGFTLNRAIVIIDNKTFLIDKNGNKIKQIECDYCNGFRKDGYCTIVNNDFVSIIDTLGNTVLNTPYDDISEFNNGVAYVSKDGKYGLVDINGKEIVKIKYGRNHYIEKNNDDIYVFSNYNYIEGTIYYYYNSNGELIWQDMPQKRPSINLWLFPGRKDFIEYFDANISNLDPIEGIYYVTNSNYYQSRENINSIGLNSTQSEFFAIHKINSENNEFEAKCIDNSGNAWVNKFVKLGDSNNYAIVKVDKDNDYSSEGRMTLEDPNHFEFRLETGKNDWYNFFVTYEFIRDYPTVSEYEQYQKAEWTGTGFAIGDGYIATNYHVTKGSKTIRVKGINGDIKTSYKAHVLTSDKEHDLSIIKIVDKNFEDFGEIPYNLGLTSVDVGENIFVLGYPMTETMGEEIKLTDGIISSSTGYKGYDYMYQISAAIQPGNSGGPLFNEDGNVIGIVCAKHADAENANYAVKVSYLRNLINTSNIKLLEHNNLNSKKLSSKVKKIKNFVYLIECASK